jgi:hypothetical protein
MSFSEGRFLVMLGSLIVFGLGWIVLSGCRYGLENGSTPTVISIEHSADADVIFIRAVQDTDMTWTFHVTVEHPDTGWDDYADGWDVVLSDGTIVKRQDDDRFTRLLLHPHETEQPFTRSQSQLVIPSDVTVVSVRAHDLVDGFGGREISVDLTQEQGAGYEVERLP